MCFVSPTIAYPFLVEAKYFRPFLENGLKCLRTIGPGNLIPGKQERYCFMPLIQDISYKQNLVVRNTWVPRSFDIEVYKVK